MLMFMAILWGAALSFAFGNAAWSYIAVQGTGIGSAEVANLNPPLNVSASFLNPVQRTVDVTWSAPAEPDGIKLDGYYVTRFLGSIAQPGLRDLSDRIDDFAHVRGHGSHLRYVHLFGHRRLPIVVLRCHQHKRHGSGTNIVRL